mmetsp:Transcript_27685/g.31053  ORF Transcript_27685/g.31053 Transcript_27685/m.31053 type:complete len:99 (+) Transcript_27685:99-395(+)
MDSSTIFVVTFFILNIVGITITAFEFTPFSNLITNRNIDNVTLQQRYNRAFPTNTNRNNNNNFSQQRCSRPSIHISQLQRSKTSRRRHPFGYHTPSSE